MKVAAELFECYGYLPYFGDRHTCEFLSGYINHNHRAIRQYGLIRTSIAKRRQLRAADLKQVLGWIAGREEMPSQRSRETAADIINAVTLGHEFVDVVNLPNQGQVSNLEALKTGPYGRCVWACDNDVADHQVVNVEFAGGQTASLTTTAFAQSRDRQARVFGSKGELRGDGSNIEVFDYLTEQTTVTQAGIVSDGSILSGHGGGDYALMDAFVAALAENDQSRILSGPRESLETHLTVFAAEKARHENRVVEMTEMGGT